MIYLSCIMVYLHFDNGCDGTCGRFCDGACDQFKGVRIKTWYIYSDATIWNVSDGEFDLCFDLEDPYYQRLG